MGRGIEYATWGHGSAVPEQAKIFDQQCLRGEIKAGRSYQFDRSLGRFVECGTGDRAVETSQRKRTGLRRLTIAEARRRLRLAEFAMETDRRQELVNLRRRAHSIR